MEPATQEEGAYAYAREIAGREAAGREAAGREAAGREGARRTQEGEGKGKPRGSRSGRGGSSPSLPDTPILEPSASADLIPVPDIFPPPQARPSDWRGTSLKNVGRDKNGKVIPHRRSEAVAKRVAIWVAGGYTLNDIAVMLNLRPGTIKQHYAKELEYGAQKVGMQMTEHIVRRAKESDAMAMFYARARMGWRDNDQRIQDTGILSIHIHT